MAQRTKTRYQGSRALPLLDPGEYVALCTEASFEWARRWSAWKARLALEPRRRAPHTQEGSALGSLKGNEGDQNYEIPTSIEGTKPYPTRPRHRLAPN
jgi:hypothetical protein